MTGGILEGEEGHVVVAGDLEWGGCALRGFYVLREGAVDETFVGAALLPDAGVDGSFEEDGMLVVGDEFDVTGEDGEGGVPGLWPAGGVRRKGGCRRCGARL